MQSPNAVEPLGPEARLSSHFAVAIGQGNEK